MKMLIVKMNVYKTSLTPTVKTVFVNAAKIIICLSSVCLMHMWPVLMNALIQRLLQKASERSLYGVDFICKTVSEKS